MKFFLLLTSCSLMAFLFSLSASDPSFVLHVGKGTWQGEAQVHETIDEATGEVCLEYSESSPQKPGVFFIDFKDPGMDQYDALEFLWKLEGSDANVTVSIEGYPSGSLRRYYLRKRPNPKGHWQHTFLSLRHDDDGEAVSLKEVPPEGKLRLKFVVSLRDLEGSADPRLIFRFSSLRFVRYPVGLRGSYGDVTNFREGGEVGQRYLLTLKNQTDTHQKARIYADTKDLRHFKLKFQSDAIDLEPNASRQIPVTISVSEEKAKLLPPLYSESVPIFVRTEDHPEECAPWLDSYFFNMLRGVVPPKEKSAPWFSTEESRKLALQKIASQPKAKALFQSMQKEANALLEKEIRVPALFHGYSGNYVCKEHASQLEYKGEGKHWCIKGKHFLEGDDSVDRAGDYQRHAALTKNALLLARMGWLTQEPRYSRKAAEILLAYAKIYKDLPFFKKDSTGFHSRVAHAVLGECWWFDPVPHALDFIRGSRVLNEEEDATIVEGLILPAVLGIYSHRIGANQQAEVNHAVGVGALVAKNWPLAAEAMDGELGIRFQWKEDFDADGISVERELPYHFAAIKPFIEMAEAYEALGVKVFDARFKSLFDAPIAYSEDQIVKGYAGFYEVPLKYWNIPEFARQVAYSRTKNWSWEALMNPVEDIEKRNYEIGNSVLSAGGYTTLRQKLPDGALATVFMNFGSPAWRGGKCLLDPQITWKGIPLNARTLRIGYGYEGSGFSYTPAAGNGLLVDGKGGSMLRMDQEAIFEKPFSAARWASSLQRPIFPDVQWARSVALCGDTIVLLDQFQSKTSHRFDLISHLPGGIQNIDISSLEDEPTFLQEGEGYTFYKNPKACRQRVEEIVYHLDGKRKELLGEMKFLGNANQFYFAESQAGWHPQWIPVCIRRFEGKSGWAVTAYSSKEASLKNKMTIRQVPVLQGSNVISPEEALAVEVKTTENCYLVLTTAHNEEYLVEGKKLKGPLGIACE